MISLNHMLKKISVVFVLVFALLFSFSATKAQETALSTVGELGIEDVGRLPTSPLYFLKEINRGLRKFFAFNRVKKAEVEAEIANEKAAEIVALEEKEPLNTEAIKQALANYGEAKERLAERIKLLEAESDNPNVEKLLSEIEEQSTKHVEVFGRLEEKFKDEAEIKDALNKNRPEFFIRDQEEKSETSKLIVKPTDKPAADLKTSLELEQDLKELELLDIERDLDGLNDY